jgi:hypothetical protein
LGFACVDEIFIFQDYAVSKWADHVSALVEKGQQEDEAGIRTRLGVVVLAELEAAVLRFSDFYTAAITDGPKATPLATWTVFLADKPLLYHGLCAVHDHIKQHFLSSHSVRNTISISALRESFQRNRDFLADPTQTPFKLTLSKQDLKSLEDLYGKNRYKCSKLDCQWFYNGYDKAKDKKRHMDHHERPFRCGFPGCSGEDFGLTSKHDLGKHNKSFHPTMDDQAQSFAPMDDAAAASETTAAKWPCPHCPKRYTRGFHLKNHIRTHTDERPFACIQCGRAFVRDYDRKRHEKQVHEARQR